MIDFFKSLKKTMLLSALVCIVLGIVMIANPGFVQNVISWICGGVLTLFGLTEVVAVFVKPGKYSSFSRIIPGILALAVGLVFLFRSEEIFSLLWMFIGLAVLIDAVYKLQYAFELKAAEVKVWWVTLLVALATLLLAVVLIAAPVDAAAEAMFILTGAILLTNGIFDLATSIFFGVSARKLSRTAIGVIYDDPDVTDVVKK